MQENTKLGCYTYNRHSILLLIFLVNIFLSSATKIEQYQLSFNTPISSSKTFLTQVKDQINCSKDDLQLCIDENTTIDVNASSNILALINHLIIKTINTETSDGKSIKNVILEAKQTCLSDRKNMQKQ